MEITRVSDLTKEQYNKVRREMKRQIMDAFTELMTAAGKPHGVWKGTMTDLMDLTHTAWLSGEFCDASGIPYSFRDMATHVCTIFNRRAPRNPYTFVEKSKQRKGQRNLPVLDRYIKVYVEMKIPSPIKLDLASF